MDLEEPIYLWAGGLPWGEHLLHFIRKVAISLYSLGSIGDLLLNFGCGVPG